MYTALIAITIANMLAFQSVLSADNGVYVVIRMNATKTEEYLKNVITPKTPKADSGKIQAFAKDDLATLQGNSWPSEKALSVIHFPDKVKADTWITKSQPPVNTSEEDIAKMWIGGADILIQELTIPLPGEDQKGMVLMVPTKMYNATQFFSKTMPDLLIKLGNGTVGGVGGSTGDQTNEWQRIQGDWPKNGTYIQIVHFPSKQKATDFWPGVQEELLDYSEMEVFYMPREVDLQDDDTTGTAPVTFRVNALFLVILPIVAYGYK